MMDYMKGAMMGRKKDLMKVVELEQRWDILMDEQKVNWKESVKALLRVLK